MSRERLIPLVACNAGNCPGIWLDPDDGSVVVQGELLRSVINGGPVNAMALPVEARVRIPADVLRRAELPPLVWAVVVGNYEPAEVLGLYGTREMAEAFVRLHLDPAGPGLQVVSFEVLLPAETLDSTTLPVPEFRCPACGAVTRATMADHQ
jgi:hypothetical protein